MGIQTNTYLIYGFLISAYEFKQWLYDKKMGSCCKKNQCLHIDECWKISDLKGLEILITNDDAYHKNDDYTDISLYYPVPDTSDVRSIVKFQDENKEMLEFGSLLYQEITGSLREPSLFSVVNRS